MTPPIPSPVRAPAGRVDVLCPRLIRPGVVRVPEMPAFDRARVWHPMQRRRQAGNVLLVAFLADDDFPSARPGFEPENKLAPELGCVNFAFPDFGAEIRLGPALLGIGDEHLREIGIDPPIGAFSDGLYLREAIVFSSLLKIRCILI